VGAGAVDDLLDNLSDLVHAYRHLADLSRLPLGVTQIPLRLSIDITADIAVNRLDVPVSRYGVIAQPGKLGDSRDASNASPNGKPR
jgi:hypothetical protein